MPPLNAEWVTVVLLLVVLLMALDQGGSPRKWRLLGSSMFSMRLGKQALREEMDLQDRTLLGAACWPSASLARLVRLAGDANYAGWILVPHAGGPCWWPWWWAQVLSCACLVNMLWAGSTTVCRNTCTPDSCFSCVLGRLAAVLAVVVFIAYQPTWRSWAVAGGGCCRSAPSLPLAAGGLDRAWAEGRPAPVHFLYLCAAEMMPLSFWLIDHWRCTSSPLSIHS
jgi:hypothetical protein